MKWRTLALLSVWLALPASAADTRPRGQDHRGADIRINFTGRNGNHCSIAEAAIRTYIDESDADIDREPHIIFSGVMSVDKDDYHAIQVWNYGTNQADDPGILKACIAEFPSIHFDAAGYPIADTTNSGATIGGMITFENFELDFDGTGQAVPLIWWMAGAGYLAGHESALSETLFGGQMGYSPPFSGALTVRCQGGSDGSLSSFQAYTRSESDLFARNGTALGTVHVVYWSNGAFRRAAKGLVTQMQGCPGDNDDIAIWSDDSGSESSYGPLTVKNFHRAIFLTGRPLSDFYLDTITINDVGVLIGDVDAGGGYGCDEVFYSGCSAGTSTGSCARIATQCDGAHFHDGFIEGNGDASNGGAAVGNDVVFVEPGTDVSFTNVHIEDRVSNANAVSFGTGACLNGTRANKYAGGASQCSGGTYVPTTTALQLCDISFYGGTLPSVDTDTTFGGTYIGANNCGAFGHIHLDGMLGGNTGTDSVLRLFEFDSSLVGNKNAPTVVARPSFETGNAYWPEYPKLIVLGSEVFRGTVDEAGMAAAITGNTNYLPIVNTATAPVAATALSAWGTLNNATYNRWQILRVVFVAQAGAGADDSCDFVPVISSGDNATLAPVTIDTNMRLGTGAGIAANDLLYGRLTPNSTVFLNPNTATHQLVGLKVVNGTSAGGDACNELHGHWEMVVAPL